MPALKIFGKPTWLADDDMRWVGGISILWRLAQLGLVITLWVYHLRHERHAARSNQLLDDFLQNVDNKEEGPSNNNNNNYYEDSFTPEDVDEVRTFIHDCQAQETTLIQHLWGYSFMGGALAVLGLLIEITIFIMSGRGTPVQTEKRKLLPTLCQVHLVGLSILRVVCVVFCILLIREGPSYIEECLSGDDTTLLCDVLPENYRCPAYQQQRRSYVSTMDKIFYASIVMHLVEFCAVGLWCLSIFQPWTILWHRIASLRGVVVGGRGGSQQQQQQKRSNTNTTSFCCCCSSTQQWQYCCYCCCSITSIFTLGIFGGKDVILGSGDFQDVAIALSQHFEEYAEMNVVPSDMLVGLYLVHRQQREQQLICQEAVQRKWMLKMRQQQGKKTVTTETTTTTTTSLTHSSNMLQPQLHQDDSLIQIKVSTLAAGSIRSEKREDDEVQEHATNGINNNNNNDDVDLEEPSQQDVIASRSSLALQLDDEDTNRRNNNNNKNDTESIMYFVRRRHEDGSPYASTRIVDLLDTSTFMDIQTIGEGAQFMKYSLAIYTWVMYALHKPCTGVCELGTRAIVDTCCRHHVSSSNCCTKKKKKDDDERNNNNNTSYTITNALHWEALLKESGLDKTQIRYASFQVGLDAQPYFIGIDNDWKSIVIAIRGTLSLDDALTDMTMSPVSLRNHRDTYGLDDATSKRYVHSGFLACAEWIYRDMKMMTDKKDDDPKQQQQQQQQSSCILVKLLEEEFPTYDLRITGHSLGAGIAAILSILLKPRYGDRIRALAFSPPGCTMDRLLLEETKSFVTSYVLDNDIVPRIAIESVETLRNDILDAIACMKLPKYQTWNEGDGGVGGGRPCVKQRRRRRRRHPDEEDDDEDDDSYNGDRQLRTRTAALNRKLLHRIESMPDSEFSRHVQEIRQGQLARRRQEQRRQQQQQQQQQKEAQSKSSLLLSGRDDDDDATTMTTLLQTVELFPPGRIVHLYPTEEYITPSTLLGRIPSLFGGVAAIRKKVSQSSSSSPFSSYHDNNATLNNTRTRKVTRCTPCWANAATDFREIRISSNFLADHEPQQVLQELEDIASGMFGLEPPYLAKSPDGG